MPQVTIPFTIEFLLEKLKDVDSNIRRENLKNYELKKFNEGQAFMSEIVQLKFEWQDKAPLDSVILKIPGFQQVADDQDIEQAICFLEGAHTRECEFYRLFASPPIPLKLPKFYYGYPYSRHHKDGLMIMEDFTGSSRTIGMLPGFSNEQMEALVIELARVYAASLLDLGWHKPLATELADVEGFIHESKRLGQTLKTLKPELFETLMDELEPAFDLKYYKNCTYDGTKFGIPSGITHNDLWAANVLWKCVNGKVTAELEAIIDWQICAGGNPGADLARGLSMNTPTKYRHANEDRLLKLYHDTVNKELNGKIPFTLDQLKNGYKQAFPYVATVSAFGAPLYYKMGSVVGDPANPELQEELLERVYSFFKEAVEVLKDEQKA